MTFVKPRKYQKTLGFQTIKAKNDFMKFLESHDSFDVNITHITQRENSEFGRYVVDIKYQIGDEFLSRLNELQEEIHLHMESFSHFLTGEFDNVESKQALTEQKTITEPVASSELFKSAESTESTESSASNLFPKLDKFTGFPENSEQSD